MLPTHVVQAIQAAPGRVMSAAQLRRRGVHRLVAAEWAREGQLERVLHGIYRNPTSSVPADQCLHAPLLYLSQRRKPATPFSLISGAAGLGVLGVPRFDLPTRPLLLVDGSRHPRPNGAHFDARRVSLESERVEWHKGLPLAEPARVVADAALSSSLSDDALMQVVDHLRSSRQLQMSTALPTWQAVPHHGANRLLLMYRDGHFDLESGGERTAFHRLFATYPPAPDCQVRVLGKLRVDFMYVGAALIIEYLGKPHDGRADQDTSRGYALERLGNRIIYVTKSMVREDAPGLASHIHGIRREREHLINQGVLRVPVLPPQPLRRVPLRTLRPFG